MSGDFPDAMAKILADALELAKPLILCYVAIRVKEMKDSQARAKAENQRRDAARDELLSKVRELHERFIETGPKHIDVSVVFPPDETRETRKDSVLGKLGRHRARRNVQTEAESETNKKTQ